MEKEKVLISGGSSADELLASDHETVGVEAVQPVQRGTSGSQDQSRLATVLLFQSIDARAPQGMRAHLKPTKKQKSRASIRKPSIF